MLGTFIEIAWKNIIRRTRVMGPLFLCIFVSMLSVVLVWSTYDASSVGVELSKQRMGADVVIYPNDSEISDVSMLYSGVAQSVYMDSQIENKAKTEEVQRISSQFYLQTLPTAGCCTVTEEMRLIGIDWKTDFSVKPYVGDEKLQNLDKEEIILGCNVTGMGENTLILNVPVHVAAVLEPTGTYLDDSIVMSKELLIEMAQVNFPRIFFGGESPDRLITCVLVDLKDGADTESYMRSIEDIEAKKVSIASTAGKVQKDLSVLFSLLAGETLIILSLCIFASSAQLQTLIYGQCREIGYMRSIGLKKMEVYEILGMEIGILSLSAGVLGSGVGLFLSHFVSGWIHENMSIPIGVRDGRFLLYHLMGGVILTVLICILSSAQPIWKIARMSPQEAMTKGEM